ncbi:nucleoid occlusion protein [Tissierella creatinophila]|uniref:Nucleoid occlusion protein n=1 Tax=Tissierella creatinophila DSM 6911 TaxID=1123403 RepID=A0A1U7M627_TISCR|nr:nucleoid occlusion protein [Tissierella creatinophila]OLS02710.1 nucleoid occlusion protein [Tissierella creatinophila DSM 6911]
MALHQEIKYIPVSTIRPNPYQPRRIFNRKALEELSQSIKEYGVIQPISVRKTSAENYELIAGERRLRATEMAEMMEIPALIVEYRDNESAIIALIENLQREDLNFIEESEGYYNLINDHNFTQQDLAKKIGKSQSTIANKLRLLKLPTEIQRTLITEGLTERHGRALLKLPDDELKSIVIEKVIKKGLNVNATENLVEDILNGLRGEEEEKQPQQTIKSLINVRIYLNTVKKAYTAIKEFGVDASYKEVEKDDHVEVVIKIPKK